MKRGRFEIWKQMKNKIIPIKYDTTDIRLTPKGQEFNIVLYLGPFNHIVRFSAEELQKENYVELLCRKQDAGLIRLKHYAKDLVKHGVFK